MTKQPATKATRKAKPKKAAQKAPAKKANGTARTDVSAAFGCQSGSLREKAIDRLAANLGKPVPMPVLTKAAGADAKAVANAIRVLGVQGAEREAPFKIVKTGEGADVAFTLRRA